jgi:hypothetical protein
MAPARSVTSWTVPVKRPIDFVVEFLSDGVADGHHVCDHPYLYGAVVVVVVRRTGEVALRNGDI